MKGGGRPFRDISRTRDDRSRPKVMKNVGMIPVYNESDIIRQVVRHLISQGVQLVIIDNGSNDRSYEICSKFVGKGVLRLERLWTERREWRMMLRELYKLALDHSPEWVLVNAADEFLESPYRGLTLLGIKIEASKGHNLIQFDNFEFSPTEKDCNSRARDVRKRIRYYSWNDDDQFRCWKVYPNMSIDEFGSHQQSFPHRSRSESFPNKFVLRHYKIRSYEHGLRKVFNERLPASYSPNKLQLGWSVHYNNFTRDKHYFIIDSQKLTRYNDDGNWSLTKTFDGTFGAWNPPSINQRRSNLRRDR